MRQSRKSNDLIDRLKRFWREYWIEVAAVLVILVGLLLTRLHREDLPGLSDGFIGELRRNYLSLSERLQNYLRTNFTLLDFIGLALGVLAVVFIFWRVRLRLSRSRRLRSDACPACGSKLHRVHRTPIDRILTFAFYPAGRRYICSEPSCGWSGILHRGHHQRQSRDVAVANE